MKATRKEATRQRGIEGYKCENATQRSKEAQRVANMKVPHKEAERHRGLQT